MEPHHVPVSDTLEHIFPLGIRVCQWQTGIATSSGSEGLVGIPKKIINVIGFIQKVITIKRVHWLQCRCCIVIHRNMHNLCVPFPLNRGSPWASENARWPPHDQNVHGYAALMEFIVRSLWLCELWWRPFDGLLSCGEIDHLHPTVSAQGNMLLFHISGPMIN